MPYHHVYLSSTISIFSHYDSSHENFNDQCAKYNVHGFSSSLCKINNNIGNKEKLKILPLIIFLHAMKLANSNTAQSIRMLSRFMYTCYLLLNSLDCRNFLKGSLAPNIWTSSDDVLLYGFSSLISLYSFSKIWLIFITQERLQCNKNLMDLVFSRILEVDISVGSVPPERQGLIDKINIFNFLNSKPKFIQHVFSRKQDL